MLTDTEKRYLDKVDDLIKRIERGEFSGVSQMVAVKKMTIRLGIESFSSTLYQFGVLLLHQYMHTISQCLCVPKKQEEFFLAHEALKPLAETFSVPISFDEDYQSTPEKTTKSIAVFEAVLLHEFFDGIFTDNLPSSFV
ncbi:MAG: hypothetical protein CL685_01430 [Candidatus Magasanikbacteria bacterium]|nr:hypothetical protein [Candidatus Magasanikbacteria bacterium]|tara:strand:+ start:2011 stop:2427 length:417 start_codon:yes stop_codon:yes gene_type:complete